MSDKIYYTKPSITDLEIQFATDAVTTGWGSNCYDYINRFEMAFREHLGVEYCIATSSCTGALHLGLAATGIGPGDEVILADTNWIASVAPINHLGATPVFVDVLSDTWCLDPQKVEAAITRNTKAILAVHIYGNMCDMDALLTIGEKYKIPVIEDAAEAIGSKWGSKRAGSLGKFGTFSFHGTKTVTTGEGGMFVTNDSALYERVLTLSNHGRARHQARQFWPEEVGFKYKMSNLQAAVGLGQLIRIDELINRKREIFARYKASLADISSISMNPEAEGTTNGYWMPTVVFPRDANIKREEIITAFAAENIDARVFFWPLSSTPPFSANNENTIAYDLPNRAINLPSYHDMSDDDQDRVISVIRTLCKHEHRRAG